jgi:tRNA-uridine 2-sulfurtransferase
MAKAILLLSGGLDSTLAGKLLIEMGFTVEAFNVVSPFCRCTPHTLGCSAASHAAAQLGIPIHMHNAGQEYMEIIKKPRFGRGKNMNPCIDCRIHLFSKAKKFMEEREADFIATGDVLGERPMSQNHRSMELIESEAGLAGLILRPLSAQLLEPTIPEKEGIVDRSRLLAISGRRRTPQFELAESLGIKDYLCPGGGCLLTDPCFARRIKELFTVEPQCTLHDIVLLRYGRHFRLASGTKVIVGRNEQENEIIESKARKGDVVIKPENVPGPTAVSIASSAEESIMFAARSVAAYIKGGSRIEQIRIEHIGKKDGSLILNNIIPMERNELESRMIGADDIIS